MLCVYERNKMMMMMISSDRAYMATPINPISD